MARIFNSKSFWDFLENNLNIPVIFKCRTTEIIHFIIEHDASLHSFLWGNIQFSGNIFDKSVFGAEPIPLIFEPNQRFTVDVTETNWLWYVWYTIKELKMKFSTILLMWIQTFPVLSTVETCKVPWSEPISKYNGL